MIIKIEDGIAEIDYKKGKRTYSKTVQLDTLMATFASQQGISTPILPFGTRYYTKKGNDITILMEIPAGKRGMHYINRSNKTIFKGRIPFPWGLISMTFKENDTGGLTLIREAICALKRPLINAADEIFHWPTPNVYGDMRICWGGSFGSSGQNKIADISEAGKLIDIYFSSNFNTDLSPESKIRGYQRYEDMLRAMSDKDEFDNNVLINIGTVSQLL